MIFYTTILTHQSKLHCQISMDPNEEDCDLDNTYYDGWTVPETNEYNDDEYDY
jgi:hypothetical protein